MNVREARAAGEPIFYGDATVPDTLAAAGVEGARAVVVLSDPDASPKIVYNVRRLAPDVTVLVRARYRTEAPDLLSAPVATHQLREGDWATGRSMAEVNLRAMTDASVLAIRRDGRSWTSPPPDLRLAAGDVLYSARQLVRRPAGTRTSRSRAHRFARARATDGGRIMRHFQGSYYLSFFTTVQKSQRPTTD